MYVVHGNEVAPAASIQVCGYPFEFLHSFCFLYNYRCVSLLPAVPCACLLASMGACAALCGHARFPLLRCAKRTWRIQCAHGIVLACLPACSRGSRQRRNLTRRLTASGASAACETYLLIRSEACGFHLYGFHDRFDLLKPLLRVNVAMSLSPCTRHRCKKGACAIT